MSSSHEKIYQWIDSWGDHTPEGTAFKLKAALALKAHEYKQEFQPPPFEGQLLEAQQLLSLFKLYDKNKNTLPTALQLTEKENKIYARAIHQTYLPGFVEQSIAKPVKIEASEWIAPVKKSKSALKSNQLANELFVQMNGSKIPPEEFSLTSDKLFVQNFRSLYEAIYHANPDSDEYRKLKQMVELAQPESPVAISAQNLIKVLILQKENIKTNKLTGALADNFLKSLAFPADF